ncbi:MULTISPECIES: nucleotide-binding protein [Acidiplasma]|jgi:predicted nucleic-acid-binding Zn-ribbon protein|uniref:Nucleotide-binding protein n=2 Tax=Acidiplasma TaxID=507753 RepID=A0A0Q0RGL6_9ARCH|nr:MULTISPECIES: nucleotide-binding protein [Acidiplasma]KJE48713.1 nucleotide-binding protein [Acidiplasma sp. MBA-1]KPV46932.1 nucleotide-binding protein [Acidiplasma aeolicum]KQB34277.1 nucleotide-binding protein [Acidiplasma cupricumulans]KQB34743.1 nucleotide-binding protein [Acidiplasma aeolicum]WMT55488.1 MAG: nucleotide-binding protein [Acidiplasma sp.]
MSSKSCPNCKVDMDEIGNMNFRVGGFTGIGGMFLGGWNDLAETTQTFTLYRCPQCGRIDFYEPQPDQFGNQKEKKHHFL